MAKLTDSSISKCEECLHEAVCGYKTQYKANIEKIESIDVIEVSMVSIICKHFVKRGVGIRKEF